MKKTDATNPFSGFRNKIPVSDDKWNAYVSCFQRMEVPAKTVLLGEGKVSTKMFFVEKGCVRVWFNNNGKDLTLQFFMENQLVSSIESFIKRIPSPVTIETIEPCVIWWIGKKDMDRILDEVKEIPRIRDMFIDVIFERTFNYIQLFVSSIKDTPRQRYLNLMKERPALVKRIPQHYIASFLGITTVHLSRVKSQIARSKAG